jgi:fumarylacetoacetase
MTWLAMRPDDPFGIDHLPYGSAVIDGQARAVVRIGSRALDLTSATSGHAFGPLFADGTLDLLLAAGRPVWTAVRTQLTEWLTDESNREKFQPLLTDVDKLTLQLPFTVGDYVDFYASEQHATNVGRLFRPDGAPLTPNWKHLPIGYHGRSGTVVVSGSDIFRPSGQIRAADGSVVFGPSRRLDIEAEVGFVVGTSSRRGRPVPVSTFHDHVFGVCLVNDWSARDIQAWESVPLGPFLGKSFATSVAAWITPIDALTRAWTPPPPREPHPMPYLDDSARPAGLDLRLEVRINDTVVSRPPFAGMYWTPAQMLAHMTVNGASVRTGDLYASGTVSGALPDEFGSLLELTAGGANPIRLESGEERTFLQDGDEVVITATAPGTSGRIQLGEVRGRIVPCEA